MVVAPMTSTMGLSEKDIYTNEYYAGHGISHC